MTTTPPTTPPKLNKGQLDAIIKAKSDPRFAGVAPRDIAVALEAEGHEAWTAKPAAPAPAPAPTPAPAPAPAGAIEDEGDTSFDVLDVGPPPGAAPAPAPAVPVLRQEEKVALVAAAARTPQLPAREIARPAGLEELDASDLILPSLTLRQAQTQDIPEGITIPLGHWFYKQQPALQSAKRKIVILHAGKDRMLAPDFSKKNRPAQIERIKKLTGIALKEDHDGPWCFSPDREAPVTRDGLTPMAKACKDCPLSRWRNGAMECGEAYKLLIVDRTAGGQGMPAWLRLRSAAIRATKNALSALLIAANQHRQPACAFELELGSAEEKRPDGNFYVPTFGPPLPLAERELIDFYNATRESALATQDRSEVTA